MIPLKGFRLHVIWVISSRLLQKMAPYYAFIKYCEKKKKTPWILRTDEIKNFNPTHTRDFDPEALLDCAWQDSESESFDGSFKAQVVCMASEYTVIISHFGLLVQTSFINLNV